MSQIQKRDESAHFYDDYLVLIFLIIQDKPDKIVYEITSPLSNREIKMLTRKCRHYYSLWCSCPVACDAPGLECVTTLASAYASFPFSAECTWCIFEGNTFWDFFSPGNHFIASVHLAFFWQYNLAPTTGWVNGEWFFERLYICYSHIFNSSE